MTLDGVDRVDQKLGRKRWSGGQDGEGKKAESKEDKQRGKY
jgi:hypothetical protein